MSEILRANDLRPGKCINYEGEICHVINFEFNIQGRGGSTVFLKLRILKTGAQKNISCNVDEKFTTVVMEKAEAKYMYDDGDRIYCLDGSDYDYKLLDQSSVGLLESGTPIYIHSVDGEVSRVSVARIIRAKIVDTEPYIQGQTAKASYKNAKLANGITVSVPPFIEADDYIMLNTEDWEYVSKAE